MGICLECGSKLKKVTDKKLLDKIDQTLAYDTKCMNKSDEARYTVKRYGTPMYCPKCRKNNDDNVIFDWHIKVYETKNEFEIKIERLDFDNEIQNFQFLCNNKFSMLSFILHLTEYYFGKGRGY
ncbi:MAG: hypothetical protein WC495_06585 [Patescibacteria group bacterium]